MALPSTGPITMDMVRIELDRLTGPISLNDADVRHLAGKPTGAISLSDLRGKSNLEYNVVSFSTGNLNGSRNEDETIYTTAINYADVTRLVWLPSTFDVDIETWFIMRDHGVIRLEIDGVLQSQQVEFSHAGRRTITTGTSVIFDGALRANTRVRLYFYTGDAEVDDSSGDDTNSYSTGYEIRSGTVNLGITARP